jgi:ABC-2 type transport system permease protein
MRILAVIDRDLKKFRRNPIVVAMSVVMPILYLLILGHSFQGKMTGLPLAVVRCEDGPASRQLLENLRAVAAGPQTVELFTVKDQEQALAGVRKGDYKAALVIPEDFTRRVVQGNRPEIGLFLDNTDAISTNSIQAAVNGALHAVGQDYVAIREHGGETYQREVNLYRQIDYFQSLVPGVVIMAVFLGSLTTGAFNLVMDRFLGVDESYMLTPLTKMDIVGGLILSGLFITTCISLLIFTVSILITGIPFYHFIRQFFSLLAVIILTTLGLLSLMFLILGRFNHPRIVGILSGFLNVILFFPSGAIYPVASFPDWLRAFARVNPEAYAVHALKSILFKDAGLSAISGDLLFLTVFTVIMLTTAVVTFQRKVL